MKLWFLSRWEYLRTSFWFLPALMVLAAIGLSMTTLRWDLEASNAGADFSLAWTFSRGPEGARAVLSVVAGSMMTITSVIFSITIVALQLASSQFGPRMLRNFMRDRANQTALGTFVATFTYCLLILRSVNGTESEQFVPHISVAVALMLTLLNLGVLIYFIHHAAESIQAETVIAAVRSELQTAIDRLYPEHVGKKGGSEEKHSRAHLPSDFETRSQPVLSPVSNYVEAIDLDKILRIATEHDLFVAVVRRPGNFVFEGSTIARVSPTDRAERNILKLIADCFYFGPRRTLTQDVEFAIDQLVEIAIRALSPGVNDPFTAIHCIDRLGDALRELALREIPPAELFDEEGNCRLLAARSTVEGIFDAAFDQLRQNARGNVAVTIRLLDILVQLAELSLRPVFKESIRRHADLVHQGAMESFLSEADKSDANIRYQRLQALLD